MRLVRCSRFSSLFAACVVAIAIDAGAQPLTGAWYAVVTPVSNTCADPLGPPVGRVLDLLQAGDLVSGVLAGVDHTEMLGVVSGSNVQIGFEAFQDGGVRVYDPAANQLSITDGGTTLSGDLACEFFEPLTCYGTQNWSATKHDAGTPDDLSGEWTLDVQEATESCGNPDPTILPIPVVIHQQGDLVNIDAPGIELGQTRIIGSVSGTTLYAGLGIRQSGFTVFDPADSSLVIAQDFASFAGTTSWQSFQNKTCTGVDSIVATLPEPGVALGAVAAVVSLGAIRRKTRAKSKIY